MTFSQTPQPTLVEAPYAATWSVDLLVESLKACSHVYFGDLDKGATANLGLDDYLKALGNVTLVRDSTTTSPLNWSGQHDSVVVGRPVG